MLDSKTENDKNCWRAFSLETACDVILHLNVSMLRSRRDFPVVDVPEFIASRIYSLFETSVRLLVFLSCSSALKFKSFVFTHKNRLEKRDSELETNKAVDTHTNRGGVKENEKNKQTRKQKCISMLLPKGRSV